jgi:hypothetical protein
VLSGPRAVATAAVGAVVLSLGILAAPAAAGTYRMKQCLSDPPSNNVVNDWTPYSSSGVALGPSFYNECASNGQFGFYVTNNDMPYNTDAGIQLKVPSSTPHVTIASIITAFRTAQEVNEFAFVRWVARVNGTDTIMLDQEMKPYSIAGLVLTPPTGTDSLLLDVYCSYGNGAVNCKFDDAGHVINVSSLVLTLVDNVKPGGGLFGGSLLDDGPRSGTQSVSYAVGDQDAGVKSFAIKLGSTTVAADNFSAKCTYDTWNACPPSQIGNATIDTTQLDDGRYPLTLEVTDAADNTATIDPGKTITLKNGRGPGDANGSNPCAPCALFVGVGPKGTDPAIKVRRKDAVPVLGRLLTPDGQPVAGARLDVLNDAGQEGSITTGADGSFIFVANPGPSRHLTFAYRAHANDHGYAATGMVFIRVKDAVRVRAKPRRPHRGSRVMIEGRLTGVPGNATDGVLVTLQGKAVGDRRWRTFATTRADTTGYFVTYYRFERASRGQRFEMRARATPQTGFPFPIDYSRPVNVRIR